MNLNNVVDEIQSHSKEEAEKILQDFIFSQYNEYLKALEFYADPASYIGISFMYDSPGGFATDWSEVEGFGSRPGKLAREKMNDSTPPELWHNYSNKVVDQFKDYFTEIIKETLDQHNIPQQDPLLKMFLNRIRCELLNSINSKEK